MSLDDRLQEPYFQDVRAGFLAALANPDSFVWDELYNGMAERLEHHNAYWAARQ